MGTEVINADKILQQLPYLSAASDRVSQMEDARFERGSRASREFVPMIITTDQQVALGDNGKYILFWSGPQNTTWTFQQRGTTQQTRTGYIAHYWLDGKRSTFFDDPSVSFTFQTGNIMPIREATLRDGSSQFVLMPPGLLDYYDFFSLLDEPKILSSGRPNFVNIVYHSLLYPTILLRGFFEPESPITVNEDASRPASVTWAATFRVRQSNPPLHDGSKLHDAWRTQFDFSLNLDDL